jgi:prophage maintenance system killer protein
VTTTPERKTFQPVPPKSVCHAYELLRKEDLVSFPLTREAERTAETIVANIIGSHFGVDNYSSFEEKAVAYLYFLIKDHPFTDGNKRTACLVFSMVCEVNNLIPKFGNDNPSLDELAVFIEKIQEQDHQFVIKLIAGLLFK